MNSRERQRYWKVQTNKKNRIVSVYKAKFYNALQKDTNSFLNSIQNGGIAGGRSFANSFIVSNGITAALQHVLANVGVKYARLNYNELRQEKGFGKYLEWLQLIKDYLGLNFYDKGVFKIVQTSREMFVDILNMAVDKGWGYYEIANYIKNTVAGINRNRSEVIARTEVARAIHAGTYVGADKSPYQKEKVWIAAKDRRTRRNLRNDPQKADHWRLDGQTVNFDDYFTDKTNGIKMLHPHDPLAPASEVVMCRCSYAVLNKRDSSGRLIRKG